MTTRAKIHAAIGVALVASAGIVCWVTFEWSLIDRFPSAVYMEFTGLAWMVFFLLATISFVALYELPEAGLIAVIPLLVQVAGVLIVFLAPLDRLWIEINFLLCKADREAVVAQVMSGELEDQSGRGLLPLADAWPTLSAGGNEIVIDERADNRFIFFYTYRGRRDNYAGFLYVPEGLTPADSGVGPRQLEEVLPMGGNWYHLSPHRGDS